MRTDANIRKHSGLILTAMSVLALVACGGGGGAGGSSPKVSVSQINSLTGASPAIETVAAQRARSPAILARTDSFIVSTMHGETTHSAVPTFRLRARCSGISCTIFEPNTGYSVTLTPSDLETVGGPAEAVGTKHGITLISYTATDLTGYGAWMRHSGFAVQTEAFTEQGFRINARYGIAGGDLTGTSLTGSATWYGLMVGRPATGSGRGDRLQGDAALTYDPNAGGSVDIAFTSIKNIDRRAAHSTPTVRFDNVPVNSRGSFQAGLTGNRIQGGFYGAGHAEAAGVFEQSNIVGAFGARKQ